MLHEKQLTILRHLSRLYVLSGDPQIEVRQTLRQLGDTIHVKSPGQIAFHVRGLEALGYIKRVARSSYVVTKTGGRLAYESSGGENE
jgi:predicted transcriptional regulator